MSTLPQPIIRRLGNPYVGATALLGAAVALIIGFGMIGDRQADVAPREATPVTDQAATQHGSAGRQGGVMEGTGGSASVARALTPSAAIPIREITRGGLLEGTGGHYVADVAPTNNQARTGGVVEGTGASAPAVKRVFPTQSGNGMLE